MPCDTASVTERLSPCARDGAFAGIVRNDATWEMRSRPSLWRFEPGLAARRPTTWVRAVDEEEVARFKVAPRGGEFGFGLAALLLLPISFFFALLDGRLGDRSLGVCWLVS